MKTRIWLTRIAPMGAVLLALAAGCSTPMQPPPLQPRVVTPPIQPSGPTPQEQLAQEEMTGQLVKFGKLRTVLVAREVVENPQQGEIRADEIRPAIEQELVARDFRLFSGSVPPDSDVAELTRKVKAHCVITVSARSKFVNSTGKFSKYRATAEVRAIRGHDGTILASARSEVMGPRSQDSERAGQLALRDAAPEIARQLIEQLLGKTDQLLWAGLIVRNIPTLERAHEIQRHIESKDYVSYCELLEWNRADRTATYEIIYGLKHESDIALLMGQLSGAKITPSSYEPGRMEALRKIMSNYK